jgi:hypothetical protein
MDRKVIEQMDATMRPLQGDNPDLTWVKNMENP